MASVCQWTPWPPCQTERERERDGEREKEREREREGVREKERERVREIERGSNRYLTICSFIYNAIRVLAVEEQIVTYL